MLEVHGADVVGHLVVVLVQIERRQRMRGNPHLRERDVVTPREEALLRSLVRSDRHTVRREDLTHRRSLKARQPRAAFAATQRVGPPDHLYLESRDERAVWDERLLSST